MALAVIEKTMKTKDSLMTLSASKKTPPKKAGRNIVKFLIQCLILRSPKKAGTLGYISFSKCKGKK